MQTTDNLDVQKETSQEAAPVEAPKTEAVKPPGLELPQKGSAVIGEMPGTEQKAVTEQKQVENAMESEAGEGTGGEKAPSSGAAAAIPSDGDAKNVGVWIKKLGGLSKEEQIKTLCDLSFQKGLDFAVSVAKGVGDAYVLDGFHDALVDEFYQKLVEQKKLKSFS